MVVIPTTYKSWEPDPPCKKPAKKKAAKKLQSFARRRWQHQRQSPLVRLAVANPFWRPIEAREQGNQGWTERRSDTPPKWLEDKPFRFANGPLFFGSALVRFLGVVISVFGGLYNSLIP